MATVSKVPAKTRAGTPLDVVYENRLADEAESGFDPAVLIRRQVGRPSLSSRGGRSNRVDLRVDDDTYNAIRRIAHDSDRRVSEVVREAIRQYLQAS